MSTVEETDFFSGDSVGSSTTSESTTSESAASSSDENGETSALKKKARKKRKKVKAKLKHEDGSRKFLTKSSHKSSKSMKSRKSEHSRKTPQSSCKREESSTRGKHIVKMFRRHSADFFRLLQMASDVVPLELYSNDLIPEDLITAEASQLILALNKTIKAEPDRIYEVIHCFEKELSSSETLKSIKGKILSYVNILYEKINHCAFFNYLP